MQLPVLKNSSILSIARLAIAILVSLVALPKWGKNEPNLNPGYLKIKSAFILPHLGSATKDTRIAMANLAIDNIDEFFKTGNCVNKVN